ncbi:phosphate--nucleotide phosphotransferase [Lacticaseibacillus casei]|jgi:PPK2 family polyphosphate:nucleotide phosphotransferase|uniref:Phosphate--nucleotide phosphotransferase n=1 Tax=Lacticaseibacillus huelsenbergensis TaxID=3035291 RepID=A0ABY8DS24_9LACO|nr:MULTISPECIES: phosphate--nucleotide phosphotransferase [Lacticaseibacillus]MDG3061767.1 phosphate--nucleotide phosphotransferase [Lacticaseibacillus sp. BCRC 81376]QVI38136.1 phosphate--nucleotide phosphotransferase [Lacticaseibacillus casei]QXG59950.1 phosphate--nucleotide phosphotransferase [Lacticaseibacillus casei]WFB38577.1 phosphate--nucleotide phosphotransferase [Lacticaseibacillus huelsenbergensis]WFB43002.1 phosphate--nucleotide phosphotransferase [Lacticaseibacillus huelsenbergens
MTLEKYRFDGTGTFDIKAFATAPPDEFKNKKDKIKEDIEHNIKTLSKVQEHLAAQKQYSVLIIFQGMDAAGKDSMIEHVMSGINPQGTTVVSFKVPTELELSHDFLWRIHNAFPAGGELTVFNRSQYEEVLVDRVHPELLLKENLPGIDSVSDVHDELWTERFNDIKALESYARRNGILLLKFFLHISKAEQKDRFLKRIEIPEKNWKFSLADIRERRYWDDYQKAYQEAIQHTATKKNPWYIIPSDDKWYSRLAVSQIINREVTALPLKYPVISEAQKQGLVQAVADLRD